MGLPISESISIIIPTITFGDRNPTALLQNLMFCFLDLVFLACHVLKLLYGLCLALGKGHLGHVCVAHLCGKGYSFLRKTYFSCVFGAAVFCGNAFSPR